MTSSTPLSSSGATLEFLKELVASSIESDDVGPLVKAVFEVAPPGEQLPLPLTRDSESGTTSQGEQLPQDSVLDSVLELLQEVAEEKEAEIQQVCRSNASEIAGAMHELGTMQRSTAALRQQLLANSATLQAAGSSFAGRLEEVQQVESLQQQVAAARKAVSVALQVLQLCTQAAKYIEGRQLYKAFKTLEAVQLDHGAVLCGSQGGYLPLLPSAGAYASSRDGTPLKDAAGGGGGGTAASDGGGGGDAELAEQLGPLAGFLRERVAELVALLEQRALSDFNNSWLANVRAQARTIGMRAIRWAAAERQQEEVLTRQRKQLLQRLDDFQDVRQAGALVAQALHESEASQPPPATPLPLPTAADSAAAGTPGSPGAAAASGSPSHSPVPDSSSSKVSSGSTSATAARLATFRAARQAASTSPTRSPHSTPASAAAAEVAVPATNPSPPGTAASATAASACGHAPTPAAASAAAAQTPPPQQRAGVQRPEAAAAATGDLLEGVDMTPLHRCVHIHTCLGRLPQFADYYATNRRQQLAADLSLHQGDFLNHYQTYLTQLAGFFLVEDAVQATAAGAAGEPLDIVAQVDAAWDAAVAALKAVLEPAFHGATAAAAMLTVKDFILLVCLALDHCGYQTVAVREVLMNSRARYHDLLAAATAASVQAAVAGDSLAGLAVSSQARADELLVTLALPSTFCFEDAANKRLPLKAPFSAMVPDLVRAIRAHITDSVAYLKGLLTAGEVVPAARQYRDRMLARVVVAALQRRVDAAAGDTRLPLGAGLQLVGNVAALRHVLPHLDEYLLAQARGESPATLAAAAAAAAAAASGGGGSPDRRGRSRSRSVSPSKLSASGGKSGSERGRGQQQQEGVEPKDGDGLEDGQGSAPAAAPAGSSRSVSPRPRSQSPGSSHGSAPSPEIAGGGAGPLPSQQLAAAAAVHQQHQQQSGSQQSGHTVLSFAASPGAIPSKPGEAAASSAATGSGAASLHAVLCSAEALVVQAAAAKAAGLLEAGEQLDWAPAEQQRSTAYSPYIEELIMHLKETASLLKRGAPSDCVERILRGLLRYVADAVMLQLMSDAVPAFNIFGLQRLFSDLGGVSRAAGSMGVPGLADELAEPLLFCELMVFGSLEDVLKPEQRAPGGRLAALDVRRMALVLEKYHELEKASAFASMHKSKQSERFISKKTVDRVLKELREHSRTASRASSVSGSAAGSFTAKGS